MSVKWKAYFDSDTGSLLEWCGIVNDKNIRYKEMPQDNSYYGTLIFDHETRGRSASIFWLRNKKRPEQVFPIRMSEMCKMLKTADFFAGELTGAFRVVKLGACYSISYLGIGNNNTNLKFEDI